MHGSVVWTVETTAKPHQLPAGNVGGSFLKRSVCVSVCD